jgi:hypothetical protein
VGRFRHTLKAGLAVDEIRYSMALKACEMLGYWQGGLVVVRHMLGGGGGGGMEVDAGMWRRLFLLLGREGQAEEALACIREMEAR